MATQSQSNQQKIFKVITLPGAPHFVHKSSLAYKVFWGTLILVCSVICAWQISDRIMHYFEYPTVRKINVYHSNSLAFPAITICSPFRYRFASLSDTDQQTLNISKEVLQFLSSNSKTLNSQRPEALRGYLIETLQRINALYSRTFNFTEFILRIGYQINSNNLKKCEFAGKPCSMKDFSFSFTSTYGVCWTFNSENKITNSVKQIHGGRDGGLKIVLDIERDKYIDPFINEDIGLKFFIHSTFDHPYLEQSGFAFSSGQQVYAGVTFSKRINLPRPYGNCSQLQLDHFSKYTISSCLIECKITFIMEICRCKPHFYPEIENKFVQECDLLTLVLCYKNNLNNFLKIENSCQHCNLPCYEELYSTVLSYSQLNYFQETTMLAQIYNTDANYLIRNFVFLNVYYETLIYEEIQENAAIIVSSLISDIGGQMGLFLGMSILTLTDILEHSYKKLKKIKQIKKQNTTVKELDDLAATENTVPKSKDEENSQKVKNCVHKPTNIAT